jgi:hypothetical protein
MMFIADLPPQITLQCHGTRSGWLSRAAPFQVTIYVDVARRRFVTRNSEFGWPRQGMLNAITRQKMVLWNIHERYHPFLVSTAEFYFGSRRYEGRIKYNARALRDEKYSGICYVKPGVPTPIRKSLQNA